MAAEDSTNPPEEQQPKQRESDSDSEEEPAPEPIRWSSSSSSSESDSDSDSDSESEADSNEQPDRSYVPYTRSEQAASDDEDDSPEANVRRFMGVLHSKRAKRREEAEERKFVYHEDLFDFPEDPDNWREEDLRELWADAPIAMTKPGWDPDFADEDDWEVMREEVRQGRDPPIAPFYLPYRKPFPVIPDNHYDISNPKAVIEELDRIEEFLRWVSYIFPDGSTYEGTVWDDLAHGRGVYVADYGLVRYEGEWLQNNMEGHGIVEVDIPDIEPVPGSKLEEQMRAEGQIISRDYMAPEDKEWLEMDIEDTIRLAGGMNVTPFYENDEWIRQFGAKPEKGRYRYAGQWKHGRMHGCGVYEVNERPIYGRFYFGELLENKYGCNVDISAMHAGIAEIAAAKARMFVNKPDGMVREERGPYNDPQHPYFYEEEDVWMAPGFINQFYEVPDYWKTYVQMVDQEREMWLNSFYKSPLRLAMPAELEHWWSKDEIPEERPEFVILNKEPEPDPEDPSNLIYTEDPVILHTPTGRIINYIEDEKYGLRLFWQPPLEEGEDVDPSKVQFLPLGYDEFFGTGVVEKKEHILKRMIVALENKCKPVFDKIEKWTEEKKKASEMRMKLIEKEYQLAQAELLMREAMEDEEEELKMREKEEERKVKEEGAISASDFADEDKMVSVQEEQEKEKESDEEEEEEEEDDDSAPSSFGSAMEGDLTKSDQKGKPGKSPFAASSLSFGSSNLVLTVPSRIRQSFLSWRLRKPLPKSPSSQIHSPGGHSEPFDSVSFPLAPRQNGVLRAATKPPIQLQRGNPMKKTGQAHSLSRILSGSSGPADPKRTLKQSGSKIHSHKPEIGLDNVLSLHFPLYDLGACSGISAQSPAEWSEKPESAV